MKRKSCGSQRSLSLIVFTVLFLAWLQPKSWAQEQSASPRAGQAAAQAEHQASSKEAAGQESREEAEKDETAKFKQSFSVKRLAQLTGLSLESAYWLGVALNFIGIGLVVAAVIKWGIPTLIPPIGPYLRERTVGIRKAMEEARKASQEANRRLAEIEARLSRLDVEIGAMHATADKEAAAEEARIQAAAEEDTRKIVGAAEQEIAAAAQAARRDLKAYAAGLAVALAQKQIRVDGATDQALVRSFADQLAASDSDGAGPGKGGR